jgi:uncharacterized protein (TIGR02145 family)
LEVKLNSAPGSFIDLWIEGTLKELTVTDCEGYEYKTVIIGTQEWMSENLKTTKYNDCTTIPNITDNTAWSLLTSGAYCDYDNNPEYSSMYGRLYNWYVVDAASNGGKNICPTGWHVPTDAEWTTMENYLIANGYNYDGTTTGNKYAKALASASGWASYSEVGTVGNTDYPAKRNSTGFTALPGGNRNLLGWFGNLLIFGGWWSATEGVPSSSWGRYLYYNYIFEGRGWDYKESGFSIRCIKD